MGSAGRGRWHWLQTRIGQVFLFWGVLELILRALDVLTKSDLLLMLRDSLASDLQFVAHPRFALLLVVLAFALLWEHNDPKKPAKSILDQPDQPQKNYSAIEATAIPFFLAFVCGVGLAAFDPSRPNHGVCPLHSRFQARQKIRPWITRYARKPSSPPQAALRSHSSKSSANLRPPHSGQAPQLKSSTTPAQRHLRQTIIGASSRLSHLNGGLA